MAPLDRDERYSFADYLSWDSNEHIELIAGVPVKMAPPSPTHQFISMALSAQLHNFLEGKKCRVVTAPFAVRLFEKDGDSPETVDTVVEPDISVICDRSRLDNHGYRGAPEMVIEILSPSTRRHDRMVKLNLYQKAGVKEYWVVSPEEGTVQVHLLTGGRLSLHELYEKDDVAKVNVLDGCFVELSKVFSDAE